MAALTASCSADMVDVRVEIAVDHKKIWTSIDS